MHMFTVIEITKLSVKFIPIIKHTKLKYVLYDC